MATSPNKICIHHKEGQSLFFPCHYYEHQGSSLLIKVMYSAIICQTSDNIKMQQVFTFFKILAPLVSISSASFVNSKCLLGFLEKIVVQGLKQTLKSTNHLKM